MGLKKLFVDVPAFLDSGVSAETIECEYMYHRKNNGQFSLLEAIQFAVYCRRCDDAFCVTACPTEALEHQENGMIKRYNMRCVGCKSCVLACPFGTICAETINYITSNCDLCLNQLSDDPEYVPSCVKTAPHDSFRMALIEEENPKEHLYFCGEHVAVKNPSWLKKENKI